MVSRLSLSLSFLVAVFIVLSPLGYKYETQSLKYHPKDWLADNFRSRCLVVFEISLPGHTPLLTQGASYHHIVADNRGVALPKKFLMEV